jgi:hypothetical protein
MSGSSNPVTAVLVNGTSTTLTLTNAVQNSAALTVGYTAGTNLIKDTAGNALATISDALTLTPTNDPVVPTVASVSSAAVDGRYKVGDVIPVKVTFSEIVTVTGTPQLELETGTTDRTISYVSGSGSTDLVFNYTVQSGDTSSDLDYKATSSLTLNGGTIKDAAGNNATLTLASPGAANSLANAKALVVDGVLPAFLNASGLTSPSNGGTLQKSSGVFPLIVLDFSESVQLITGKTLANNISIVSPLGAGDKSIGFVANVVDGNVQIDISESDTDITSAHNQLAYISIAANTLQDAAGNVLPEIVGVNSYGILLNV